MIISASRRTDIPAFYAQWFAQRMRAGEVWVRNPMQPHQVRRVKLNREVVDGIVFWTRDPAPLMDGWDGLDSWPCYFHFTLTGYGADLEPGTADKQRAVDTFRRLAERLGPHRVLWRYDPLIFTPHYTPEWHAERFAALCAGLHDATRVCITSFLTTYAKTRRNLSGVDIINPGDEERRAMLLTLAGIAGDHDLELRTCCTETDIEGLRPSRCIDPALLGRIRGDELRVNRDTGQRPGCRCAQSIDIGAYDTCLHGCRYCYATSSSFTAVENASRHKPHGHLLVGERQSADTLSDARQQSCTLMQGTLF